MNTAVAEQQSQGGRLKPVTANELKKFLLEHKSTIQGVAANALNADRMTRIVLAAATQKPTLLKCDPMTILRAMAKSAELGLECEGGLGEAYLVPFYNSQRGCHEAQFIPGYQGLIAIAVRSGMVKKVECAVVYDSDDVFDYEYGTAAYLKHRPAPRTRDSKVIAFYAIVLLEGNIHQFEVMWKGEVDKIMERSKAKGDSPWKTDFDEMGKKTVVRRIFKRLPKSVQMQRLLEDQETIENSDFLIPEDVPMPDKARARGAAGLKEQLGGQQQAGEGEDSGQHAEQQQEREQAQRSAEGGGSQQEKADKKGGKKGGAAALPATADHIKQIRDKIAKIDVATEHELCKAMGRETLEGITQGEVIAALAWLDDPAKPFQRLPA